MKYLNPYVLLAIGMILVFSAASAVAYWYPSAFVGGTPTGAKARTAPQALPSPLRTPGPPGLTLDKARAFEEFPLYWLGDTFEGLPLTEITRERYDPSPGTLEELSRTNSAWFIYGDCVPTRQQETGCPIPLWLMIEPNCARSRKFTPDDFPLGVLSSIAGLPARQYDEAHIVLWVGKVTLTIGTLTPKAIGVSDVVAGLKALNPSAATLDGQTIPPDLSSCSAG